MSRFIKAAISLTPDLILAATLQARMATAGVSKPGSILLAQEFEQEKAKNPAPQYSPPKSELGKSMKRAPQPEHMHRKTRSLGPLKDEPERAGTKKIGGHTIRAKETPNGE
jgi:hypothetical protein